MKITDIDMAYVISLAKRADRREKFWAAWQGGKTPAPLAGIPASLFLACDGREFDPPRSWDVGRGAFGCYLSHISILTDAVRAGETRIEELKNFLVLEDDAVPCEGFREKLAAVLADLPDDFDQLYLGWQALHSDRVPPTRITEHLGRAGNCNRNHAILYSRKGAVKILKRLLDLSERKPKHHIDHWLGELHEELDDNGLHRYNCYISIPAIVYQAAGNSDISGKETPLNKWLYTGTYKEERPPRFSVLSYKTAFGDIGRRGSLGYENRKAEFTADDKTETVSLHAPSVLWIENTIPLTVGAAMNKSGGSRDPVRAAVDGQPLGYVQAPDDRTREVVIEPGKHCLEFLIDKVNNAFAHTFWILSEEVK